MYVNIRAGRSSPTGAGHVAVSVAPVKEPLVIPDAIIPIPAGWVVPVFVVLSISAAVSFVLERKGERDRQAEVDAARPLPRPSSAGETHEESE